MAGGGDPANAVTCEFFLLCWGGLFGEAIEGSRGLAIFLRICVGFSHWCDSRMSVAEPKGIFTLSLQVHAENACFCRVMSHFLGYFATLPTFSLSRIRQR